MKKLLLFIGLVSSVINIAKAQSLTYDMLPVSSQLGSSASFTLSYTSTVPAKISVALYIFNVDGEGNLTQDWSTWQAGTSTSVLPATSNPSSQDLTLNIPGSVALTSALPAGKTYVWALSLNTESDSWITGSQHSVSILASDNVVNDIQFDGVAVTEVNAGTVATISYNYTMVSEGIIKVALSKYSSTDMWISDVASYIVNPAASTAISPVAATAEIVIPSDVLPSESLSNGETYKWEISLFSPDWVNYLSGTRLGVIVNAPTAGIYSDKKDVFFIYPNPATDILQLSGEDVTQAQIFNIAGKCLLNYGPTKMLDVSSLPTGLYFISINSGSVSKFIKN